MDLCVYMPFLQGRGTPICCRTFDEVEQLIEDMCALFPRESDKLREFQSYFGTEDEYKSEIAYRFRLSGTGGLLCNYCTYEFYRKEGYQIVEFADILAEYGNEEEGEWELEDLSILFT